MISLIIPKEVYTEKSLNETIRVYKGYADIVVEPDEYSWKVHFSKCKFDADRTIKEFENYLIGIENT